MGDRFGDPGGVAISAMIDYDDLDRRDRGINHALCPAAVNNHCRFSGRLRQRIRPSDSYRST
jgi:hypothetical protein